jgi:hypothetical protein
MNRMNVTERMYASDRQQSQEVNVRTVEVSTPTGASPGTGSPGGRTEGDLIRVDSASLGTSPQDSANLPACRQSEQLYIGDPLTVPSEPADADAKPTAEARGSDKGSGSPGLSQVLGKVLQQLSISAWVPAAMLVGNVAVLLQLRADGSYNIAKAVKDLAGKPLGTIIILAFALILATVVTQAFEFEAIRFLEGYFDSANGIIQAIIATRIRRHEGKRERLDSKLRDANRQACQEAVARMRGFRGYDPKVLDYLSQPPPKDSKEFDSEVARKADATNWKRHSSPAELYRIDSTAARLGSYPDKSRLLPTRLGNVLRVAEDKIDLGEYENLEGYVVRYYDQLPPTLQSQHRDYRTRLDMYCSLALVFFMLVALSAITLYAVSPLWGMAVAVGAYALMACLSYQAAIASARSYGLILQEIPQYLARQDAPTEAGESSALARLLALLHRNAM